MTRQEKIFDRKRHAGRGDLAGEYRMGDLGQLLFLLIFLAVWIADNFFLKFSVVLANPISWLIRIPVGIGILLIAGWLARSGLSIVFGKVRQEPRVIREGVFGLIRHPIYLGAILVYLGLLVFATSIAAALIWVVIIGFYYFLCRHEEKLLTARFGADYTAYKREVPMLLPRSRSVKPE